MRTSQIFIKAIRPCALLVLLWASMMVSCGDEEGNTAGVDAGGTDTGGTPTASITPRFELQEGNFYRMPWPSDYRVREDGSLDLSDFPNVTVMTVGNYVSVIEAEVDGFATMPVVFVGFDERPGTESFPQPSQTLLSTAPIQLLDVSVDGCGQRIPIEVRQEREGDDFRDPFVLMAAPVPGFPLSPATPYALVILKSFGSESELATARPAGFEGVLEQTHQDATLNAVYAPLVDCLSTAGLTASDIAIATVFTTQDPVAELRRIRNMVMDPARVDDPEVTNWALSEDGTRDTVFTTYTGTYQTPIFQRGDTPYAAVGGGIRFDESGEPIVQRWEEVPFAVTVPDSGTPPYPVLVWVDGTGASLLGYTNQGLTQYFTSVGFVVATYQPQFHGDRSGPNADESLHTFNYVNPESGRSVFRQQAADTSYFIRVIRSALGDIADLPELDTSRLIYAGHSQGALVGAIVAGVETEFEAYLLNGIGGYLSITIVERKDPFDIAEQIRILLSISSYLDRFHPIVALAQLGGEAADPINYAPHWTGWEGHTDGSSMFLINGGLDPTTSERAINAITVAGGVVPIEEAPGWDVDPFGVWDIDPLTLPITSTTTALDGTPLTLATYLSSITGHYTIYDEAEPRSMAVNFLLSALEGTPELVQP